MFSAVGVLSLDTLKVTHAAWVSPAEWTHFRSQQIENSLLEKYGPRENVDYTLLRKGESVAVCYRHLPLPTMDIDWLTGAYWTMDQPTPFDAALGAMVGAALAVTFDGMQPAAIADMLFLGVNDQSFCPFWLQDGILNITGSALQSTKQRLAPGGTEPAFGEDLFSVFEGFVYDGTKMGHRGPEKDAYLDHPYANVAWDIAKAVTLPLRHWNAVATPTLQDVCARAVQGGPDLGPVLAAMCLQIGVRQGSAGFPKRWCDVVAKPKNSLSFISVIYKLQTSFGFVFVPPSPPG
jgi:hypothetical protein